jgi:septum formation inhibitor MinC
MSEVPPSEESLRQELETLGKNLIGAMRSAWEAPESKRLREEVTTGLSDLVSTLKREAEYLAAHPATQQIKTDVEQIGEKIKAPEAQVAVRRELLSALHAVNSELQKLIDRWSEADVSADAAETSETPAAAEDSPPPDPVE